LKAESTALDGATGLAAGGRFWVAVVPSVPVDLVAAFGVGEGFGATVRVRVDGDVEFVF